MPDFAVLAAAAVAFGVGALLGAWLTARELADDLAELRRMLLGMDSWRNGVVEVGGRLDPGDVRRVVERLKRSRL